MKQPAAVCMVSLGCAKNHVDAELFLGAALGGAFAIAADPADADIIVINTCGFIESAREECREEIAACLALRRPGRRRPKVVAMGCWAQRDPDGVRALFPGLDGIWGLEAPDSLARRLAQLTKAPDPDPPEPGPAPRLVSTLPAYAWLRIADGCDNRCAYCAIPLIRGGMRSRPEADILQEACMLADQGAQELLVIAQDTTAWGADLGRPGAVADLLEKILTAVRVPRVRLLYAHPKHISDRVIELLRTEPRLCGYVDLPLQHVSDRLLRAMGRGYGRARVDELLDKLGSGLTLRTTLLTGFPGETDADFAQMLELVERGVFWHLGVFSWSPEQGTPAFALDGRVPADVADQRRDALMQAQARHAFARLEARVGTTEEILLDGPADRKGWWLGRSIHEAPDVDGALLVHAPKAAAGSLIRARIKRRDGYDLVAEELRGR